MHLRPILVWGFGEERGEYGRRAVERQPGQVHWRSDMGTGRQGVDDREVGGRGDARDVDSVIERGDGGAEIDLVPAKVGGIQVSRSGAVEYGHENIVRAAQR